MLNFANIWNELKHVYSMVKTYVMGYIGTILGLFSGIDVIQYLAGIGGLIFVIQGIANRRLDRQIKLLDKQIKESNAKEAAKRNTEATRRHTQE